MMLDKAKGNEQSGTSKSAKPGLPLKIEGILSILSGYSTLLVVLVLFVCFGFTSPRFFTGGNILNILQQMSIVGVLGVGMTLVILLGGIDLSVGSVVLLSGGIAGTLITNYHLPVALALLLGIASGGFVGLVNGLLIEKLRISPIIVTLGTMIAVRGIGQVVLWINNSWVWTNTGIFVMLAGQSLFFLPLSALIMLVLYAIAALGLKQTNFGRYLYAIGGNERASWLCGLPVTRIKVSAYILSGVGAGIAGILTAAHTGVVNPTLGDGMEFDAITAVVLGGASLSGGAGRVEKTLLGVAILVMLLNYLTLRGVPDIWQTTVTGLLTLAAVLLDRLLRRAREA